MTQVTAALVGIGGYGEYYAGQLLQATPERNVRLVAGIDAFPERSASRLAFQQAGTPIFSDLESFYRQASADLVILAAPIHLHAPLTCLALAHGSNVLCEKPLCATLEQAQQMAAAERQAGKFVAVGYQWSFCDAVQALKRDVQAGVLGRPRLLKTLTLWPRRRSYYQRNTWAGRIHTDDGQPALDSPVNNATAHYLHNMLYILGDGRESSAGVKRVEAEVWRANPIENYDTAALRVTTESGAELLQFTTHAVAENIGPLAAYHFEEAVVEYGADQVFTARFHNGTVKQYGNPEDSADNKLWQAVEAVRSGEKLACGIQAALPHLECVNRIQETARIANFPREMVHTEGDEDPLNWVEGLAEAFQRGYAEGRLPVELPGLQEWRQRCLAGGEEEKRV